MARRPQPQQTIQPAIELAPLPRLALSIEEAAEVLGLGRNLTLQLIDEGRLRVMKVGRRVLVPLRAIEEMLAGS